MLQPTEQSKGKSEIFNIFSMKEVVENIKPILTSSALLS